MSNEKSIKGVLTLVPTSFDGKDELDLEVFKENIRYLESVGMHGVLVASSAGEFYELDNEEFKKLAAAARESCKNMLCVVNCSHQDVRIAIERVRYAEDIGADFAMVYPYHYHQTSVKSSYNLFYEHLRLINEATHDIRFVLFNDTRETKGFQISHALYARLLEDFPRIVASVEDVINASEGAMPSLTVIFSKFGERVNLLARSEAGMFPAMALGGKGCLATYGLAMPKLLLRLYDECESKDFDEALKDHQTLTKYPWQRNVVGVNFTGRPCPLFPGTVTIPIGNTHVVAARKVGTVFPGTVTTCKALAEAAGRKVGDPRLPMIPPSQAMKDFARGWLTDIENSA